MKWNTLYVYSTGIQSSNGIRYGGIRLYSTPLILYYINIQTVRHYILRTLPGTYSISALLTAHSETSSDMLPNSNTDAFTTRLGLQQPRKRTSPTSLPKRQGPIWASVTVLQDHATSVVECMGLERAGTRVINAVICCDASCVTLL